MNLEEYFTGVKDRWNQFTSDPALFLAQSLRQALPTQLPGEAKTPEEKQRYLEQVLGMFGAGSLKPFGKFLEEGGEAALKGRIFHGEDAVARRKNEQEFRGASPVRFWSDNPHMALGYAEQKFSPGQNIFGPHSSLEVAEFLPDARKLKMNTASAQGWAAVHADPKSARRLGLLGKDEARALYDEKKFWSGSTDQIARALMKQNRFDVVEIPRVRDWVYQPRDMYDLRGPQHDAEVLGLPEWFSKHGFDSMPPTGMDPAASVIIGKKNPKAPYLKEILGPDYGDAAPQAFVRYADETGAKASFGPGSLGWIPLEK